MTKTSDRFINREISWLSFNERVLQEAEDPTVPLIERLKFLGIFSSNLDEFFRVRVSTLQRMVDAGITSKEVLGGSPRRVLKQIHDVVVEQRKRYDKVFEELESELEKQDIFVINESELTPKQREVVQSYFEQHVRPALVPVILNDIPRFPYLKNQVIYLAIRLGKKADPKKVKYALIDVPAGVLPRFFVLPKDGNRNYIIMLDDVIRHGLKEVFGIFDFDVFEAYTVKVTRDAEIDIDDDVTKSTFERVARSLKQRRNGQPVRFVHDKEIPADLLSYVVRNMNLTKLDNIIPGGRYHNTRDFMTFPDVGGAHLKYPPMSPLGHRELAVSRSIMKTIADKDVLLHYPYQSFHYFIDLLREAAIDPKVSGIKITIYRVPKDSRVVNALLNAVQNGKQVTVVMELQARFDEETNIYWTKQLEDEGAKVINGVPGLKVHAKMCLITRREGKKNVHYVTVGTGNFNENTATLYGDHALFTSDKRITNEVRKLFEFLENNYKRHTFRHLLVSPTHMRKALSRLIKRETKNAREGKPAYIHAKFNGIIDAKLIRRLYEASQAGVEIRLVVRGVCSLVPGVPGLSDNIRVISIVDRYLEHSRVAFFCNGGKERCYIFSADWMPRNLDHRVEIAVPVYDPALREELRQYLEFQFKDTQKARLITEAQDNPYLSPSRKGKGRAQFDIYSELERRYREASVKDHDVSSN